MALLVGCSPDPGNASFSYRASVEQVHVWKAPPHATLTLTRGDAEVARGEADEQGSLLFRKVPPGDGYTVRMGEEYTRELEVVSVADSQPPASFYTSQQVVAGYQYLTMRDGVVLSAYVTLPGPIEDGPYPTVVNYSGYGPSEPGRPLGEYELLCDDLPALCDAPNAEASLFAALLGYATVSVNIRGTGCSGGAYDYFETLQVLDGYDVVEIVARQPWVKHNKVGMVGLSYPGITQLFVARARPPGLAAITPLSVIGNTSTTLVPGGMLNNGFALAWVTAVLDKARPYGQGWEQARVDAGDTICEENQLLHSQRVDNVEQARTMPYYVPEIVDPLNPEKWVEEIDVPVFLVGAWHDEQTGPFFGVLLDRFKNAPALRMTAQNGVHIDAYAPDVFYEWKVFLDLFVAREVPRVPGAVRGLSGLFFEEMFDTPMSLPPERFGAFETHEAALEAWMAEPQLRLIFESGAGKVPGAPEGTFELGYPSWPPDVQTPVRWYFHPDGSLQAEPPADAASASVFEHDPAAGDRGILAKGGGGIWSLAPNYDWRQPAPGSAVVFETEPLADDQVMAGTGSVDVWIRSTATEADLEVNLSEVRPDGQEMYVQSGWLRASQREPGPDATVLYPHQAHLEEDARPLEPGQWVLARVPIAPFAHAFRAGSRIRLSVDTPGDSRAEWRFLLADVPDDTRIAVGHDASRPSSVALPVLSGVSAPTPLPACTLRGQQCRPYAAYDNVLVAP